MPRRPLAPCAHPRCPELVAHGRCEAHRRERERARGSAHRRGLGRAWEAIRDEHIAMEPLCRHCKREGRITAAVDVDHIVARRDGGSDDHDNLQSLCKRHHSIKTRAEMKAWAARRGGAS